MVTYLLTLNGVRVDSYQDSVVALQYAILNSHVLSVGPGLNQPLYSLVDLSYYNGHYYSALSPGLALVSLPVAALGFIFDGMKLSTFGHVALFDEGFVAFLTAVGSYFFYKLCRFYANATLSFLTSLTFSVATLIWPLATVIFDHDVAATFLIISIYLVLRSVKKEQSRPLLLMLAGLSLGLAVLLEYVAFLLIIPVGVYLLATSAAHGLAKLRKLMEFGMPTLCGVLVQLSYNYAIFSNPLVFPEQYTTGSTGSLVGRFSVASIGWHSLDLLFSPYRGLFFFSPVLILGLAGLYMMIRNRRECKLDAFLFASLFLLVLLFYSSWQTWNGGAAYGPRFLTLGIPFLAAPISFYLDEQRLKGKYIFFSLFVVSVFLAGAGALTNAYSIISTSIFLYQPIAYNIPQLLTGNSGIWWLTYAGWLWQLLVLRVFAIGVFLSLWAAGGLAPFTNSYRNLVYEPASVLVIERNDRIV